MLPSSPSGSSCAPSMLWDGFLYKLHVGTGLNLLKLIRLHLPFLAQGIGKKNQFFCLITELSKAGSYQDNTCVPTTGQAQSSYPCSNQRAGNNSYILSYTASSCSGVSDWSRCLMFANRARVFQNTRTFAKHWRPLRTCFLSQLLWKLRSSKVLSKSHLMMKNFTFNS